MSEDRPVEAALCGNPNCGKTTLFNALTGGSLYVGNWPGVTVEKRVGRVRGSALPMKLADLPGMYSLRPETPDEAVASTYLYSTPPDVIIDVLDGTSPERGLYLTLQLLELGVPMVIAVNMADEAEKSGVETDCEALSSLLGVVAVPISALGGQGIARLLREAERAAADGRVPPCPRYGGPTDAALDLLLAVLCEAPRLPYAAGRCCAMLLESGEAESKALSLTPAQKKSVAHIRAEYARQSGMEPFLAFASARYGLISSLCAHAVKKHPRPRSLTEKLDSVLTHRLLALPIFFSVMLTVFFLAFGPPGKALSSLLKAFAHTSARALGELLALTTCPEWLCSLAFEALSAGVGSVLSFLPQIALLFLFLSILEDSGYMARAAFVSDGFLRRCGLSGRSFIPMLLGFGCSVPALMALRGLGTRRERAVTAILIPFMSCGAKLPVYGLLAGSFFPGREAPVIFVIYFLGLLAAGACAVLFKSSPLCRVPSGLVMELPPYRLPGPWNLFRHVWERVRGFVLKAGTVILAVSVLIWVLKYFGPGFSPAFSPSQSLLARIGGGFAPLLSPLGFGSWESAAALLAGLAAKESCAATLTQLGLGASSLFTPLSACSYMLFVLLYPPCAAAACSAWRELGAGFAIKQWLFQLLLAWSASFCFYQLSSMLALVYQ